MSAFDAQVNVVDTAILVSDEDTQEASVQVALTLGIVVPVLTPQGMQPAVTSFGTLRYNLADRESAEELSAALGEAAVKLPKKKSDIMVASNLNEVERAAQRMSGLVTP